MANNFMVLSPKKHSRSTSFTINNAFPQEPENPFSLQKRAGACKSFLVASLTLAACFFTYYFHAVIGIGTIVSHFYYLPIILACIWWQRKGIWIAVLLVAFLFASHQLFRPAAPVTHVYIRMLILMAIAAVVAELSERIASTQRRLEDAREQLEKRVEERTAQLADANRELKLEIEQHKRTEEHLELSARRLEQRNAEVKNFAYIVSHDLRAPLINLKGFSAELRRALDVIAPVLQGPINPPDNQLQSDVATALQDVSEALEFIGSSTNRMDSLISALLHLSRLGRADLKLERIDMQKKVRDTLNSLAHQIAERQIEVIIGPLPVIEADKLAMEQILGNLVNNAVLYSVPGRKGVIEITSESGLDQVTFHVKDNGRGVALEDMDKVFMPFRRAGNPDVPGEGMGLAYAQALVNRHGGHIQCRSKAGEGSIFSFTLPVCVSNQEA